MTNKTKSDVSRYRKLDPKSNRVEIPTPKEFIQYIIDSSKDKGPDALDNHIKPIWTSCPFCSMEFDAVGHLEEFDKDSAFINVVMNLMVSLSTQRAGKRYYPKNF